MLRNWLKQLILRQHTTFIGYNDRSKTLVFFDQGQNAVGWCNGVQLFNVSVPASPANGFVGVGTDTYGYADFDNLYIDGSMIKETNQGKPLHFIGESFL